MNNKSKKQRQGSKPTRGKGKAQEIKTIVGQLLKKKAKARPKGRNNRLSTKVGINDNMNFAQRVGENRSVLVTKEEPIGVIASNDSASFGLLATYAINPGQANTFPLLSQEAAEYETYLFELLEFFTVPLVSEYASGGQTGEMAIAVNFNASLPQPASQTAQLTLEPCDANLPCLPLDIRCPKEAMHKRSNAKFVRTGNLPGQSDIKEYDVGNLFVTGEGLSATQFNVCRLFVRYRCRLFTRVNLANQGAPINNSVTQFVDANAGLVNGTPFTCLFAGVSSTTQTVTNGLNAVNAGGSITLPAGNYMIHLNCQFYDSNNDIGYCQMSLAKNGTVQYPLNSYTTAFSDVSAVENAVTVSFCSYMSLNGTDAITVIITSNHSGGTTTSLCLLTIMAI
jgi:hypothetical protein